MNMKNNMLCYLFGFNYFFPLSLFRIKNLSFYYMLVIESKVKLLMNVSDLSKKFY